MKTAKLVGKIGQKMVSRLPTKIAETSSSTTPAPVDGDIIEFQVLDSSAIPNGGNINGNGWICRCRFKGMSASSTIDISKIAITVKRPGWNTSKVYSATAITETLAVTGVCRRPYSNHAQQLNNVVGSDIDVYFALTESVYVSDTITSVVVTSGFYGSCNTKTITTGITNSSTRAYAKPIPSWLAQEPWDRLGASGLTVELCVDHFAARNGQPVAYVEFYVTSGTESTAGTGSLVQSNKVTSPFRPDCYRATVPIGSLTDGAGTLNARIYPWIGDAVWDTATLGDAWPTLNFPASVPVCVDNAGNYTPAYAYVSHSGSQVGTPSVSTTPPGAYIPGTTAAYANIKAAGDAIKTFNNSRGHNDLAGGVALLPTGLMAAGLTAAMSSQVTYPPGLGFFTVQSESGTPAAGTGITSGGTSKSFPSRTKFKGLEILPGAAGATHTVIDGTNAGVPTTQPTATAAIYCVLDNCIGTGQNDNTNPVIWRCGYRWYHNCSFTQCGDDMYASPAANFAGLVALHGGTHDNGTGAAPIASASIIGVRLKNLFTQTQGTGVQPDYRYVMRWWVRLDWEKLVSQNFAFNPRAAGLYDSGLSYLNVLVRETWAGGTPGDISGSSPTIQISPDYNNPDDLPGLTNALFSHVTASGGRCNLLYNEATPGGVLKEMMNRYCALVQKNSKGDLMDPDSGGPITADGTRQGNAKYRYGVDCRGVVTGDLSANSNIPAPVSWLGEVTWPGSEDNVGYANMWISDTGLSGSNTLADDGDYTPKAKLKNRIPAGRAVIGRDLFGGTVPNDGTGAAGAKQA